MISPNLPRLTFWRQARRLFALCLGFCVLSTSSLSQQPDQTTTESRFDDEQARFSFHLPCPYTTQRHEDTDGTVTHEIVLTCNHVTLLVSLRPPSGDNKTALRKMLQSNQEKALAFLAQENGDSMIGEPQMVAFPNHWALTFSFQKEGHYALESEIARAWGFDVFLTVFAPSDAHEAADQAVALVHRTFSAPAEEVDTNDERLRTMRGIVHRIGLRRVYEEHRWNVAALQRVTQLLDSDSPPRFDFLGKPQTEEVIRVLGDDPGSTWRMFLSIFYPGNRPPFYNLSEKEPAHDAIKRARDIAITESEWRSFTVIRPDHSVTLRSHTDVGSILTAAEVGMEVETALDLDRQRDTLNTHFIKLFEDDALDDLGFDPKINFEQWASSDAGLSVAESIFGVYRTITARLQARTNVLGISEVPPRLIDIWVYRDKASFQRTLAAKKKFQISEHLGRSFALITPAGAEIHVIAAGDVGPLRMPLWHAAERSTSAEELRNGLDQIFYKWAQANLELIGIISHELDHTILTTREPNRPLWWIEGQATYYGEWLEAIQSIGMAYQVDREGQVSTDAADQSLAVTCYESNDAKKCDAMTRSAIESGKLASPRAKEYARQLSRLSASDLQANVRRLLLTPPDEFHQADLERLNYALSWALASVILQANRDEDPRTSKLRTDLRVLSNQPLAAVRDGIFAGHFDSDIGYLAKAVHAYAERMR